MRQLSQRWPLEPHAWLSVPGRHLSPTQQPLQFVKSHWPVPHDRVVGSQVRPFWLQSVQFAPNCPQALGSVPARQVLPPGSAEQHPFGQSVAQLVTLRPQTLRASQNSKPFAMQSLHR
jgi:hypothetical protein